MGREVKERQVIVHDVIITCDVPTCFAEQHDIVDHGEAISAQAAALMFGWKCVSVLSDRGESSIWLCEDHTCGNNIPIDLIEAVVSGKVQLS